MNLCFCKYLNIRLPKTINGTEKSEKNAETSSTFTTPIAKILKKSKSPRVSSSGFTPRDSRKIAEKKGAKYTKAKKMKEKKNATVATLMIQETPVFLTNLR
ncbi:MAG: hypothetical protein J7J87_00330 [Candidatus Diapherotrites archaeon]|nr:hypothetical protein [Candidatus Diapherotrites archaeon]